MPMSNQAIPSLTPIIRDEAHTPSSVRDYVALLKPRVMTLVVFCGAMGIYLAPGYLHPLLQVVTILCIALATGASGAINMWYERDIDALMKRTANRPIPTGRVSPENALAFGVTVALFSVLLLGLAVNWLAAGVLMAAIATYVGIYTLWLKRRSPQNIVIGGAAGAFPPMIGWAAVTGDVGIEAWLLFAIIFLWTPPHFWALALFRNEDYQKAGVPMMPVVRGHVHTKNLMFFYTALLVVVSIMPYLIGMSGAVYLASAVLLGSGFMFHAWRVWHEGTDRQAMAMFKFSLIYLFLLYTGLVMDHMIITLLI